MLKKTDKQKIITHLFELREPDGIYMGGHSQYVKGFNRGMRLERENIINKLIDFIDKYGN